MAQVALAWVLKNPVVSAPIVGATKTHHLADAVAALDLTLTEDEIAALEDPYTPPAHLLLIGWGASEKPVSGLVLLGGAGGAWPWRGGWHSPSRRAGIRSPLRGVGTVPARPSGAAVR